MGGQESEDIQMDAQARVKLQPTLGGPRRVWSGSAGLGSHWGMSGVCLLGSVPGAGLEPTLKLIRPTSNPGLAHTWLWSIEPEPEDVCAGVCACVCVCLCVEASNREEVTLHLLRALSVPR